MAQPYYAPESARGKELMRWEKPYVFERFPLMMYQARRNERTGKIEYQDLQDEGFTRSCWKIVRDEHEERRAHSEGWREHPREALDLAKREEERISEAAANRYHQEQRLSPEAQAEAARKDQELSDGVSHVPEIPEEPLPPKPTTEVRYCQGKTAQGKQCSRKAKDGGFCQTHSQ